MSDINKSIAMWKNLTFSDFSYSTKLILDPACIGLMQ